MITTSYQRSPVLAIKSVSSLRLRAIVVSSSICLADYGLPSGQLLNLLTFSLMWPAAGFIS